MKRMKRCLAVSTEDYTKWAREQYEKERKIIERLGLTKKK